MAPTQQNDSGAQPSFTTQARQWLAAFWPIVVTVAGGALFLRKAIVGTIMSTPHPAFVVAIFGIASVACVLLGHAFYRYNRERALAVQLARLTRSEAAEVALSVPWESDFKHLYSLVLATGATVPSAESVETELLVAEEHLLGRLTLATYLGGSLVGLGLVGTFVGLLEALADLSAMFTGLMNAGGGAGADPVAMFRGMLGQLREPMKGMGTAFVASLYGLLGSLLIGLVGNSVRQSGKVAASGVRTFLRGVPLRQSGDSEAETLSRHVESLAFVLATDRLEIRNALGDIAVANREQARANDRLSEAGNEQVRKLEALGGSIETLAQINLSLTEQTQAQLDRLMAIGATLDTGAARLTRRLGAVARAALSPTLALGGIAAVLAVFSIVSFREFSQLSARMDHLTRTLAATPHVAPTSAEEILLLRKIAAGLELSAQNQATTVKQLCRAQCPRRVRAHTRKHGI